MISYAIIQSAYVNLYKQLRRYVWDFSIVELIADLEVACFKAFPDINDIIKKYEKLDRDIRLTIKDDEDLNKELDKFRDTISDESEVYVKLYSVKEVI